MTKLLRDFASLQIGIFIVLMFSACGADTAVDGDVRYPTKFVKATPSGGDIAADDRITITFDGHPLDVSVNVGTVGGSGKNLIITGPFPLGPLELRVTWADGYTNIGTLILNFTVHSAQP